MHIKIHKTLKGIPRARCVTAAGVTDLGAPQVNLFVSALDSYDMSEVVASLRLSPTDARDLAARLVEASNLAEAQARQDDTAACGFCGFSSGAHSQACEAIAAGKDLP